VWSDATGHADLWNGSDSVGPDYGGKAIGFSSGRLNR
jgi:hypothetical protein